MPKCVFCGFDIEDKKPGRGDECLNCNSDLHCCFQCVFYNDAFNNSCRENQAERTVEKERSNFCSYFQFGRDPSKEIEETQSIKEKLNDLFKKK